MRAGRPVFKRTKASSKLGKEIQTGESANEELNDLLSRLEKIYRRVNMDVSVCVLTILNTIYSCTFTLFNIFSTRQQ